MSTYVELEIQNLLNKNSDLGEVSSQLILNIESSPDYLTLDNINALARFLLLAKQESKLIEFILNHIENENFHIPWPYFLEALGVLQQELTTKTLQALLDGILEDNAESEAARSASLQNLLPQLKEWAIDRKYKIHKDYQNNKQMLIEQLVTLRTQQLYQQEKELLRRLQKLYPGDRDIQREVSEHKQRYAVEILSRRSPRRREIKTEDLNLRDPALEQDLKTLMEGLYSHAKTQPNTAFDFAVAAYMLENYEEALELLELGEKSESLSWFHMEVLLKARRFAELLTELAKMEVAFSHEPETFFATAYLRAQALWGLGQKHTAIEVMEGLVAARPHYRAAAALLRVWSGQ